MKIRLKDVGKVDFDRTFSASLRGGGSEHGGYNDMMALSTFSNDVVPGIRTTPNFVMVVEEDRRRMNKQKVVDAYGVSRSRDKKGRIVKRNLNPYVNCIHTCVGGGHENMWVLIAEIYEDEIPDSGE